MECVASFGQSVAGYGVADISPALTTLFWCYLADGEGLEVWWAAAGGMGSGLGEILGGVGFGGCWWVGW